MLLNGDDLLKLLARLPNKLTTGNDLIPSYLLVRDCGFVFEFPLMILTNLLFISTSTIVLQLLLMALLLQVYLSLLLVSLVAPSTGRTVQSEKLVLTAIQKT